jgi:hypothetical protein
MSAPMTIRYAATEPSRAQMHEFVEAIRTAGFKIIDDSGLLPEELTPNQISALIDRQFGIDREQLNAERAAQLQPGAECACDS